MTHESKRVVSLSTRTCLAPSLAFARARALARLHLSVVSKPLTDPVSIDTISDNLFSPRCRSSLAAARKRRKMSMMAAHSVAERLAMR